MKFGVVLPGRGRLCTAENLVELATGAERCGFDSVWLTDHVALPREYHSRYPYTSSGKVRSDVAPGQPWLEITTAMTWVLSRTESVQVGSAVIVAALRPAVLLAKQLSSMAFLSAPGRLIIGLGAGWLTEEIDALGLPSDRLGARLSDTISIMRWCWSGADQEFVGATCSVPPLHFAPGVPPGHRIPILVGGHSRAALRRAVEVGDGWIASHLTPSAVQEHLDRAREIEREVGPGARGGAPMEVVCRLGPSPEIDVDLIRRYADAGVTHLVLDLPYPELEQDDLRPHLDRLARVVALARSHGGLEA